MIVGALAVVLLAVTLMVTTSNDIAERKVEVDQLEADLEAATAEAERLAAFTRFATLRTQRESTLASLAQSRFDWERVMRELALIIPEDVTLTDLNGSAVANAEGSSAPEEIGAPTSRSRAAQARIPQSPSSSPLWRTSTGSPGSGSAGQRLPDRRAAATQSAAPRTPSISRLHSTARP